MRRTDDERFDEKWVENENGCWIWMASKNSYGYGQFCNEGRLVGAHRYSWVRRNGTIPQGMELDHFRMNRNETRDQCSVACVNPEHLELVTHAENCRRSELNIDSCRKTGRKNGLARRKYSLPEGVTLHRKRFMARIWDAEAKKLRHIGYFDSPKRAHRAYLAEKGVRDGNHTTT